VHRSSIHGILSLNLALDEFYVHHRSGKFRPIMWFLMNWACVMVQPAAELMG
jgi:hypothetical protein